MAIIKFKIDKKGSTEIEVTGVTGASCEDITRAFEDGLGVKTNIQHKPDFYVELEGTKQYVSEDE